MIRKPKACGRLLFLAPWLVMLLSALFFLFCPGRDLQRLHNQQYSVVITDRNGEELQVMPLEEGLRREYSGWDDIPPEIRQLFIRSEDRYFMAHCGIDPTAVFRALFLNLSRNRIVSGASTITMQLARMLNPHREGYAGKLGEMLIALRYEANFSKKRIFSAWISSLPFGRNIEGIASASRMYFNCRPDALSVPQGAMLSIIPRSPRLYGPDGNGAVLAERMNEICRVNDFTVSEAEIQRIIEQARKTGNDFAWPDYAKHFCRRIRVFLKDQKIRKGRVATSLDFDLQQQTEYIVREKVFSAADHRISNAAALVMDPESRQILVWVGSVDYYSRQDLGMNDGVLAKTQPGSTLKPFLYELALENGYTAASLLPDIPMQFGRGELYQPMDFNNHFNGPVRLRVALASSLNVPAVYTLNDIGIDAFIARLRKLGFSAFDSEHDYTGLGLALGGVDVSLLELANAYCSFADHGNYAAPVYFPDRGIPAKREVMDGLCSAVIQDILTDPVGRITGFGQFSTAQRIKKAMIKTGTSNQFNNIWAVGTTPQFVAAIWMGNFTGETIIGKPGSSLPAQAVADFLSHMQLEKEFVRPTELRSYEICPLSGKRKGPYCPDSIREYFQPGMIPDECDFHRQNGIVYPAEYAGWLEQASLAAGTSRSDRKGVHILSPIDEAGFYLDPFLPAIDQQIVTEVTAGSEETIQLYYDQVLLAEGRYYIKAMLPLDKGRHMLEAVCAEERDQVFFTVR